jgi:methylated-DNA-[protein]-cysteine S-methyltransferase
MAEPLGFSLFSTRIGWCGVAWSADGLVAVQLPEADRDATWRRLRLRVPEAPELSPPIDVQHAIDAIVSLLETGEGDLRSVVLDDDGVPDFHRAVYDAAREIPAGSTLTYGQLATHLGDPQVARAVGQALGQNPFAIVVPCHRIVGANGKPGGFSAGDGVATKMQLLRIERAPIAAQASLFDPPNLS